MFVCSESVDKEKIVKSSFGGWPDGSAGMADGELSSQSTHWKESIDPTHCPLTSACTRQHVKTLRNMKCDFKILSLLLINLQLIFSFREFWSPLMKIPFYTGIEIGQKFCYISLYTDVSISTLVWSLQVAWLLYLYINFTEEA